MRTFCLTVSASAQTAPPPKADPHAPENAGRSALIKSLDDLAAAQTAARRAEIAKIHTRAQAEARQTHVRETMLRLIGPLPAKTPLNAQVLGGNTLEGMRIQKILFDSQPGFHVTALLYLPDPIPTGKLPAIVVAPGHGATGKASDFGFASLFARNGFAVLSYDPIGQGERLQYPDPADPTKSLATRPTGEHGEAGLQPVLIGESLAKYMLWDGMRAVDYLQSRPEIDPARIGAFGCSGGGAMTALLGGLDPRIAATGTACYTTSFDTLLPAIGPQDGEQSTPGWIAAGLDFPDWIEVAAPRPYAIIATESDMFPFAGAQSTEAEARQFYNLFASPKDLSSSAEGGGSASVSSPLAFIHGPGGHGNLRPIQTPILQFFLTNLAHTTAAPILPPPPSPGASPFALPAGLPKDAFQVTSTGQVATAYPGSATVFSLNLAHARTLTERPMARAEVAVRMVTGAVALPGKTNELTKTLDSTSQHWYPSGEPLCEIAIPKSPCPKPKPPYAYDAARIELSAPDAATVQAVTAAPKIEGRKPALLVLTETLPSVIAEPNSGATDMDRIVANGNVALYMTPRPSPSGSEELKSSLLGPFYLLGLRAELVGKTILGLRVDDVIHMVDLLADRSDVDPKDITAEASGHLALVLLHAAVLDARLKHVTLTDLPPTYRELIANPMPKDAPQDILPGVLLHYDIPDLLRALGSRVTLKQRPDNPPVPPAL